MFELLKQHKFVVGIGVVFAIIAIAYGLPSSGSQTSTITSTTASQSLIDPTLVQTFLTVSSIDLSGTIFTESAFTSLQDFSTPIVSEPIGRSNPFAPLAGAQQVADAATSTAAARIFKPASSAPGTPGATGTSGTSPSKRPVIPRANAQ